MKKTPPLCIFANDIESNKSEEFFLLLEVIKEYSGLINFKKYVVLPEILMYVKDLFPDDAELSDISVLWMPSTDSFSASIREFFRIHREIDSMIVSDIYSVIKNDHVFASLIQSDKKICLSLVDAEMLDNFNWKLCAVNKNNEFKGWINFYNNPVNGSVKGVLGVYFIRREAVGADFNLSNDFRTSEVDVIEINETDYRSIRGSSATESAIKTIFCDLDGTLVEHDAEPDSSKPLRPLPGLTEFLSFIHETQSKLVVCTARSYPKDLLLAQLNAIGIFPFDVVVNCTSGQRVLVNDDKPRTILRKSAAAVCLKRNEGPAALLDLFKSPPPDERLIAILDGNSGAHTWLIAESNGERKVKKFTLRGSVDNTARLESQFYNLIAYKKIFPKCFLEPTIGTKNSEEFSFYLPYLPNKQANYTDRADAITQGLRLTRYLKENFYIYPVSVDLSGYTMETFNNKVRPRIYWIESESQVVALQLDSGLTRNLLYLLDDITKSLEKQSFKCNGGFTHGDLTLENVLFGENEEIVLIDIQTDNGSVPWVSEFGKLLQSLICKYELWEVLKHQLRAEIYREIDLFVSDTCTQYVELKKEWSKITGLDLKSLTFFSLVYLLNHLIRMIPYQCQTSYTRAKHALTAIDLVFKTIKELDFDCNIPDSRKS